MLFLIPCFSQRTWIAGLTLAMLLAWNLSMGQVQANEPTSLPRLATEVAFPNLKFNRPVVLAYPEDESNLLFVVEQNGPIHSFPNEPRTGDKQVFLDISERVYSPADGAHNEEGLLGLAFHPAYKDNGEFFVYYSHRSGPTGRRSIVSRFRVSKDDPRKADPNSEEIVWVSDPQPYGNHNGGCILFGPDGYFYIALGDGGSGGDPLKAGQDPTTWFATILRIDVNNPSGGKPYGIPADNPSRRDSKFAHWLPEIYAIGLRNVWKFSFDRETGTLWAGDVGQNKWEEVVIVDNAGNYGWNVYEGFHPFQIRGNRVERSSPPVEPIVEYPHPEISARERQGRTDTGKSITGGYVYRGQRLPELVGAYVYGDYDNGRMWGLRINEDRSVLVNKEIIDLSTNPKINVAAYGEDRDGELYILGFDGRIHRFVPAR